MALVTVKNGDLYRAWITYLSRGGPSTPEIRTRAFFMSEAGRNPPVM